MIDGSRRDYLRTVALAGTAATAGCLGLLDGGSNGWRDDWVLPNPDKKWQSIDYVDHATVRDHAGDIGVRLLATMGASGIGSVTSKDAASASITRNNVEFVAGDFDVDRIGTVLENDRTISGKRHYVRDDDAIADYVRYEDPHYGNDWYLNEDVVAKRTSTQLETRRLFPGTLESIAEGDGETLSETDEAYAALVDRLEAPTIGRVHRYEPGLVPSYYGALGERLAFPKDALASGESVVIDGETTTTQRVHVFPDAETLEAGRDEFEARDTVTRAYSQDDRFLVTSTEQPTAELNPYGEPEDYDSRALFALELTDDEQLRARYVDGPPLSASDVVVGTDPFVSNLGDRAFDGTIEPGDTAVADELELRAGTSVTVEIENQTVRSYCWGLHLPVELSD